MQTSMRRRQRTHCNKTQQEKEGVLSFFFFLTQLLMEERGVECGGLWREKK